MIQMPPLYFEGCLTTLLPGDKPLDQQLDEKDDNREYQWGQDISQGIGLPGPGRDAFYHFLGVSQCGKRTMEIINTGVILGFRGNMNPSMNIPEVFVSGSQQFHFGLLHATIDPGKGDEEE